MNVSIFGMGYVGSVLAACLAENGQSVVGVDVNPRKVATINEGGAPVDEPGVDEKFADAVDQQRITATTDAEVAVRETDVSFLTVGTPLGDTLRLRTTSLYNVMDSVLPALQEKDEHTFVVRSTVPPRATRNLRSYVDGEFDGDTDVDFLVNPEFLREGTAIEDFYDPPYVIIGAFDEAAVEPLETLYRSLDIQARVEVVEPELAESLKLVNNGFHALKICFANEVSSVAARLGVDGKALMELVRDDEKLNISPAYLEPGFAFGGACLPKDSRALATLGAEEDVSIPLLEAIVESNDDHLSRVVETVDGLGANRVGIAGISFKSGTMDLRNSPGLRLASSLDTDWVLYADELDHSRVLGSNRDYLDKMISDLESRLVEQPEAFLQAVDVVVLANDGSFDELFPGLASKTVVDPNGTVRDRREEIATYLPVVW